MADQSELSGRPTPRTGVIVCDCGGTISGRMNVEQLIRQTAELPGVVYTHHEAYPCSKDGQERLRQAIREHSLERVLIAGCAPRLVEKLFRQGIGSLEMDPGDLMVANIRELTGQEKEAATREAFGIIEVGTARLATLQISPPRSGIVNQKALVIGAGLSGLSVALALAEKDIPVTVIGSEGSPGEPGPDLSDHTRLLTYDRIQAVKNHPKIRLIENALPISITGHPGEYEAMIDCEGEISTMTAGTIIVANASKPKPMGTGHWFDRSKVKTQSEFALELEAAQLENGRLGLKDVVFILCAEESQQKHCSRVCCNIGLRQAIQVKRRDPSANVTVLFRELYLSGIGGSQEEAMVEAKQLGITFFRYRQQAPPVIGDKTIDIQDVLTQEPVRVPYDRVVLSMPLIPSENTKSLSALLGLPLDEFGFMAEPRVRLRPGSYADPGIYVLGSAQQPADTTEALFQAYLTSARALRFLQQETIRVESPVATIDSELCTGCGNCTQVCPAKAIHLESRDGVLSLSTVDELLCIGCGNCSVVCPVKAITLPGWDNLAIPAQISAALDMRLFKAEEPKMLMLACEWSAYGAAEAAGHRKMNLPENMRILRMNCSARFDPFHILWAFLNGADGVLLGACNPGECHYGMGNLYARERVQILHNELAQHGIDPKRLRLEFFSVHDDEKIHKVLGDFENEIANGMTYRESMPIGTHARSEDQIPANT